MYVHVYEYKHQYIHVMYTHVYIYIYTDFVIFFVISALLPSCSSQPHPQKKEVNTRAIGKA